MTVAIRSGQRRAVRETGQGGIKEIAYTPAATYKENKW